VSEDLERLDRLLKDLQAVLEVPVGDDSPEWTWQRVDLLERTMGPDALRATLRRQGVSRARVDEALEVLARRRASGASGAAAD
jgi:hypothetical protein